MIAKIADAVRAFAAGVGALFRVLYNTPHGC
jgi:hypothetical protein